MFSFADILLYRKVKANLEKNHIPYIDWTLDMMHEFTARLMALNQKWGYELATCGEKCSFDGIAHNHCIDDNLIIRLAYNDAELMKFLKVQIKPMPTPNIFGEIDPMPQNAIILPNGTYAIHGNNHDKGQRQFCGCINSKDIGEYNTCPHLCEYCYANTTKQLALQNWERHKSNPHGETITSK